jgi:hypothetical protein
MIWVWLILFMVGVVVAVTIVAWRSKESLKEPCPEPSVLEKIVMTTGPTREIVRYIREQGSSQPVSISNEFIPDVSPSPIPLLTSAGYDHILFLGTPTDKLKSWVRTLPLVPDPVIIRIEPVKEVDDTKRELLSQLMALSHAEGEVVLVVDTKGCTLTSNDAFEPPILSQPYLYSSKPLVYGFHRKHHHALMEAFIGEYKRLMEDTTYQVDLLKCLSWVSATPVGS